MKGLKHFIKGSLDLLLLILVTLGQVFIAFLTAFAYILSVMPDSTDDDEKDRFMNKYDNNKGGIKVDNKHYSFEQAESDYEKGKFYDKQ